MIVVLFLLAALTSIVGYLLITGRLARKERSVAVRRVTGKEAARASGRAAAPVLIELAHQARGTLSARLLEKLRVRPSIERLLETAALKWSAAGLANRSVAGFLAAAILTTVFTHNSQPLIAFAAGIALGAAPFLYVRHKATRRLRKFEEQFPDCLEFIARSMRAGHAFSVSLDLVHRESGEPLASEFRRTFEEQNLGQPLEIVLQKLGQRMPSMDVQFFVSAVLMQKRTGGNLSELLDRLASLIRERFKLRARVRAISAMGVMSGRVLSGIPIAVAALICTMNPTYGRFFVEDPVGHQLVAASVGLQVMGYLVMRKMVKIEV